METNKEVLLKLLGYNKVPKKVLTYLKGTPLFESLTDEDKKLLSKLFPTNVTVSSNFVTVNLTSSRFDALAIACSLYMKYRISLLNDSKFFGRFTENPLCFRWIGMSHPNVSYQSVIPIEDCTEGIGKDTLFTAIKSQLVNKNLLEASISRFQARFHRVSTYHGLIIVQGKSIEGFTKLI